MRLILSALRRCSRKPGACGLPIRRARLHPRPCRCTWWSAFEKSTTRPRPSAGAATARWWRCARKQACAPCAGRDRTRASPDALDASAHHQRPTALCAPSCCVMCSESSSQKTHARRQQVRFAQHLLACHAAVVHTAAAGAAVAEQLLRSRTLLPEQARSLDVRCGAPHSALTTPRNRATASGTGRCLRCRVTTQHRTTPWPLRLFSSAGLLTR